MDSTAGSLFLIALCAAVAPLLAKAVPRRLVSEVVLLLLLGMLVGPQVWGLAEVTEGVEVLRELGLGMLFLLAGYEIEVRELTGRGGRRALLTWLVCLGLAVVIVLFLDRRVDVGPQVAVGIALTSTALGTLLPILKDEGLVDTRLGTTVLHHGAVGELGPVVAMALLLGSRGAFGTILVLMAFALTTVALGVLSTRVGPQSRLVGTIRGGSGTTSQTGLRLVVLLLGSLMALTLAFQLEVVLGAFAAGIVLRRVLPRGDERLEHKLEGLAFGLLIPCFFITSGMGIDPQAVADRPLLLLGFLLLILLVRGVPVYLVTRLDRSTTGRQMFSGKDSLRIALYGATGLPIIVAVTSVAVRNGQMAAQTASLLVAAGAITVLLLPTSATLIGARGAAHRSSTGRPPRLPTT